MVASFYEFLCIHVQKFAKNFHSCEAIRKKTLKVFLPRINKQYMVSPYAAQAPQLSALLLNHDSSSNSY